MALFTGCGKSCVNGCGEPADPNCMADMCDKCCVHWTGLNGVMRIINNMTETLQI